MHRAERRKLIFELVQQSGTVTVTELCQRFDVSDMTIRRDLTALDREGLLRRVHGGAVNSGGRSYEPPYLLRSHKNVKAKKAIGRKAAEMIYDGDSIALDVGTTTLEIAGALAERRNLTIITASLPIANEIVSSYSLNNDFRLILTGGTLRPGELSMVGHFAKEMYRNLHVDKAFLGIGGISLDDGLTEYNLEDALVKRVLLASASQKVLVADGSKFGKTTFASVGALADIDTIVTDASAPEAIIKAIQDEGIQVIIAG